MYQKLQSVFMHCRLQRSNEQSSIWIYYLFLLISLLGRLTEARDDITEPRRNKGEGFVDKLFGVCTLVRLPPDFAKGLQLKEALI